MVRITILILSVLLFLQLHLQAQLANAFGLYCLLINLITLVIYGFDKRAARLGKWRVKESSLHLLALAGGWWGALFAQQFLRHKSVKKRFLVMFSVTMLVNISLIIVFYYGE